MMIERKGVDASQSRNYLGMIMASNSKFVVPAGQDARRYFVLNVSTKRLQDTDYFGAVALDLENGGLSHLLHFLQNLDLTGFNIRNVPKTDALAEQKSLARSGVDALVEGLAQDGQLPCHHDRDPDVAVTSGDKSNEGFWAWVRQNHPDLRYSTPQSISGILQRDWGCKKFQSNGTIGLRFPALWDLRAKFDQVHGRQEWGSITGSWIHRHREKKADFDSDSVPF
jgi:hypothetical protein